MATIHPVPLLPCIRIGNDGTLSEGYALLPLGVKGTPALTSFVRPKESLFKERKKKGGRERASVLWPSVLYYE